MADRHLHLEPEEPRRRAVMPDAWPPDADSWRPRTRTHPIPEPGAINVVGALLGALFATALAVASFRVAGALMNLGARAFVAPVLFLATPFVLGYAGLLTLGLWLVRPRGEGRRGLSVALVPVLGQVSLATWVAAAGPWTTLGAPLLPAALGACAWGPVLALPSIVTGRRFGVLLLAETYGALLIRAGSM